MVDYEAVGAPQIKTTIVAQATPPGRGGVGIVRVSGSCAQAIAKAVLHFPPRPRHAHYGAFYRADGSIVDYGIALYFAAPHSFTGEDVLELQAHGGPIVMDLLIREIIALGAVAAAPGEFSERAFLNGKLDLTAAEAIADLIAASSEQAARAAVNSLQGVFAAEIHTLVDKLTHLRMFVEASIDFVDEAIEFLTQGRVADQLTEIATTLELTFNKARQGVILQEGMQLVIVGKPNAGKSSLLNALSGRDSAIVTDIAGTTRDLLREHIHLCGIPVHITDTAGLRTTSDVIEQEGIKRAGQAIASADYILLMVDASHTQTEELALLWPEETLACPPAEKVIIVRNKCDLTSEPIGVSEKHGISMIRIAAKTGDGIDALSQHLAAKMGMDHHLEGTFSARRRHLTALAEAKAHVAAAHSALLEQQAFELVAAELQSAQQVLGTITGTVSADNLLGKIFSEFCIGK